MTLPRERLRTSPKRGTELKEEKVTSNRRECTVLCNDDREGLKMQDVVGGDHSLIEYQKDNFSVFNGPFSD